MVKGAVIVILVAIMLSGVVAYPLFFAGGSDFDSGESVVLQDPTQGLSVEEAAEQFDESFVLYLLASIGANELNAVPITGETPKFEIYVDGDVYFAEVVKGSIEVEVGSGEGEDIIIRTGAEEAVKMIKDRNYVRESFVSGKSGAEIVAGYTKLGAKGYLKIQENFS